MKLFTYYTESHKYLYDNFLEKTVNKFGEYELISGIGNQHCDDGSFMNPNFGKTTFEKIKFLLDSNEWESNETIMFADVDVVFLGYTKEFLLEQIGDMDMIFQNDKGTCNTGIYLCRKNKKVKSLLENVLEIQNGWHNEQLTLNHVIYNHDIKYNLLDKRIWNVSFDGIDPWEGNDLINFPNDILMFHANYMVGVKNKVNALSLAYNKFF